MHDEECEALLLELIEDALSREMRACEDVTTFLRDNSTLSDLLSKYISRDPGSETYRTLLEKPLAEILRLSETSSLELTPSLVYKELVEQGRIDAGGAPPSPDEAAAHPAVRAAIAERAPQVMSMASGFLASISAPPAVAALPFGSRYIAKVIFTLAARRLGAAETPRCYSFVGGFLFLRCINPRVICPESVGLGGGADGKAPPSKRARRNLTIVAKLLQALSNGVRFGQLGKERELEVCNQFIDANAPRLHAYFDAVMDVPELSVRQRCR